MGLLLQLLVLERVTSCAYCGAAVAFAFGIELGLPPGGNQIYHAITVFCHVRLMGRTHCLHGPMEVTPGHGLLLCTDAIAFPAKVKLNAACCSPPP